MIVVDHYIRYILRGCIRIQSTEVCTCPACQGSLRVRDSKLRRVINQAGEIEVYRLRRYKCQSCGQLHVEMPRCVVPYKHYAADVIGAELFHVREDCPAEDSTMLRWRQIAISFLSQKILPSIPRTLKSFIELDKFDKVLQSCNQTHPLCMLFQILSCYNSS